MRLIQNFRRWRACRSAEIELGRLSNRQLEDLGIARHELAYLSRKVF